MGRPLRRQRPSAVVLDACAGHVEWEARLAVMARVSLMLIGETDGVLAAIRPYLGEPVATLPSGSPLAAAAPRGGTVILPRIDSWMLADQRRLSTWLTRRAGHVQIVSTAPVSLLPLVETGRFLEQLYYRLNTVCVTTDGTAGTHARRSAHASQDDALAAGVVWPTGRRGI